MIFNRKSLLVVSMLVLAVPAINAGGDPQEGWSKRAKDIVVAGKDKFITGLTKVNDCRNNHKTAQNVFLGLTGSAALSSILYKTYAPFKNAVDKAYGKINEKVVQPVKNKYNNVQLSRRQKAGLGVSAVFAGVASWFGYKWFANKNASSKNVGESENPESSSEGPATTE